MITDASILILFARTGRLDLLRQLFPQVLVPVPVWEEGVVKGPALPDVRAIQQAHRDGWIQVREVPVETIGALTQRFPNLGLGEVAAIALAVDPHAKKILMDDASARKAAQISGLRPIGSPGVVARLHHDCILEDRHETRSMVRDLVKAGLWVTAEVVETFWDRLGGREDAD